MTIADITPASVGIGLKPQHYREALADPNGLGFFEIHAENFMGDGGPPHRWLAAIRDQMPISVHGVCLSVGGRDPLEIQHLARLAGLVERVEPALVSEHLAWSSDGGAFLNDLLPPPMTQETLSRIAAHVDRIQETLKRRILIENPSLYLDLTCNEIPEPEFLNALAARTGCGLLLDINNVYVSASNLGFDADAYVDAINADAVEEIHLAGHAIDTFSNVTIRVDNHGSHVCEEVLSLYHRFILRAGPRPTLVEWDTDIPSFETLKREAQIASDRMASVLQRAEYQHALR